MLKGSVFNDIKSEFFSMLIPQKLQLSGSFAVTPNSQTKDEVCVDQQ
jgi:hypothetical protein